ncbi:MAG: anthranilate phosphoribosyltransferase, partial [Terriglobales bacterium]
MPTPLQVALQRLLARQDLTREEARALLESLFTEAGEAEGGARDVQIGAVLTALAAKGESVAEMVGFAEAMRAAMVGIGLDGQTPRWVDTCGTGGGSRHLFNISTA